MRHASRLARACKRVYRLTCEAGWSGPLTRKGADMAAPLSTLQAEVARRSAVVEQIAESIRKGRSLRARVALTGDLDMLDEVDEVLVTLEAEARVADANLRAAILAEVKG
ncbi:hypothetical protein SEA_HONK_63 [Microbacterium phage Honk]|uniref:Uncharacterized protein n=1 Tax=Microbacterium phage Honk TaxID=2836095 RepID=A0A8F3E5M4_9CAUD|nr:hypothetical protein SEA_HONK_63 [Microbacterium phage Honk]